MVYYQDVYHDVETRQKRQSSEFYEDKQTNYNDLLEKDGGTKNCIYLQGLIVWHSRSRECRQLGSIPILWLLGLQEVLVRICFAPERQLFDLFSCSSIVYLCVNQIRLYTERNKWYILTHLCESGYCLQINLNYKVNRPNCCKLSGQLTQLLQIFRSMTQIFVKSAEM